MMSEDPVHAGAGEQDQESEPVGSVPHGLGFRSCLQVPTDFLGDGLEPVSWTAHFCLCWFYNQPQDSELENQV